MATFSSAIFPAISLHYNVTPYILDKFPFCFNKSKNILNPRKYTTLSYLLYRFNLSIHFLYVLSEIYLTVQGLGGIAAKAIATQIVLCNCVLLCLRWELQPDNVPILVINKILKGTEGTFIPNTARHFEIYELDSSLSRCLWWSQILGIKCCKTDTVPIHLTQNLKNLVVLINAHLV